jgi:hypothetical protein
MVKSRQLEFSTEHIRSVRTTYRPDLYRRALAPLASDVPQTDVKVERFFDDGVFDPADVEAQLARGAL